MAGPSSVVLSHGSWHPRACVPGAAEQTKPPSKDERRSFISSHRFYRCSLSCPVILKRGCEGRNLHERRRAQAPYSSRTSAGCRRLWVASATSAAPAAASPSGPAFTYCKFLSESPSRTAPWPSWHVHPSHTPPPRPPSLPLLFSLASSSSSPSPPLAHLPSCLRTRERE